jgi:hypothetical protein
VTKVASRDTTIGKLDFGDPDEVLHQIICTGRLEAHPASWVLISPLWQYIDQAFERQIKSGIWTADEAVRHYGDSYPNWVSRSQLLKNLQSTNSANIEGSTSDSSNRERIGQKIASNPTGTLRYAEAAIYFDVVQKTIRDWIKKGHLSKGAKRSTVTVESVSKWEKKRKAAK